VKKDINSMDALKIRVALELAAREAEKFALESLTPDFWQEEARLYRETLKRFEQQ